MKVAFRAKKALFSVLGPKHLSALGHRGLFHGFHEKETKEHFWEKYLYLHFLYTYTKISSNSLGVVSGTKISSNSLGTALVIGGIVSASSCIYAGSWAYRSLYACYRQRKLSVFVLKKRVFVHKTGKKGAEMLKKGPKRCKKSNFWAKFFTFGTKELKFLYTLRKVIKVVA